jgi:hypothetical protein
MSYGKIYETTYWGIGRNNTIGWGNVYKDLGVDTDYQAVLDYANDASRNFALPSFAQQQAQSKLVADLKTAGVWAKLDALYVLATDGDSDFATLNWKAPSANQADKSSSPTFTTNIGFNGNGTSSFLELPIDPETGLTNYVKDSASFGVYSWDDIETADNNYPISQSTRIRIQKRTAATTNRINNASPTSTENISTSGTGLLGLNRTSSSQYGGLSSDGSLATLMNGNSITLNQVGNFTLNKFGGTYKQGRIGLAWVGGGLTSSEWADYVTAVNTYIGGL